ncbi:MAG: M1 family peptidase [Flavobacteriaceae bacterium]|nr:M1 family peptidase [Flavobacteriaceae bacterium]
MKKNCFFFIYFFIYSTIVLFAQNTKNNPTSNHGNKFEQLGNVLPDANTYRTASGAPGSEYWQQQANYKISATLDEKTNYLMGDEQITYINNSPDALRYLWLQLDENEHSPLGENNNFNGSEKSLPITVGQVDGLDYKTNLTGYGVNIIEVTDAYGRPLPYTINMTMMRIDLPKALQSKQQYIFRVKWNYKIPERKKIGGRGGFEYFPKDGNHIYTISQWYPRMCVYSDYQGWNHKQFSGQGEFSLVFGNFDVHMTVPADHVVASTGECQNYADLLSTEQLNRWEIAHKVNAESQTEPIEIVDLAEAKYREQNRDTAHTKTWHYKAENVRDFAWGSSRKFVWDAMAQNIEGKTVMCMSYYGKEAYGLYRNFSTKVVAHTLKTYSKYTIPYQYPVAISVEASSGMEYPMICFNYGRTDEDGSYSSRTKYGMIGVIIHEVGHNFFPMIINSDERNWSWMDEGLNTFVQFLTEQEFDNNYPSSRGPAHKIVDYMKMPKEQLEPIMTNSENIIQFGPNAYAKPATAMNILRETIMGRTLFDFAFKEYCRRWAYRHPAPADLFRTMEDASGVDLDWFWRAWFYDIEPVDISMDSVLAYRVFSPSAIPTKMDTIKMGSGRRGFGRNRSGNSPTPAQEFQHVSKLRNKAIGLQFAVNRDTMLRDFYYYYNPSADTIGMAERIAISSSEEANRMPIVRDSYKDLALLNPEESKKYANTYLFEITFTNKGGAVMPIILQWNYVDGSSELEYINAYIWRKNEYQVIKNFAKQKDVLSIVLDPFKETADIDEANHTWPRKQEPSRFELFKAREKSAEEKVEMTPMKRALKKK